MFDYNQNLLNRVGSKYSK